MGTPGRVRRWAAARCPTAGGHDLPWAGRSQFQPAPAPVWAPCRPPNLRRSGEPMAILQVEERVGAVTGRRNGGGDAVGDMWKGTLLGHGWRHTSGKGWPTSGLGYPWGTAAHGQPTQGQKTQEGRSSGEAEEKDQKWGVAKINHYTLRPTSSTAGLSPWLGGWEGLSRGENKGSCGSAGGRRGVGLKLKGEERHFPKYLLSCLSSWFLNTPISN